MKRDEPDALLPLERNDAITVKVNLLRHLDKLHRQILDDAWTEAPHYHPRTRAKLETVHRQKIEVLLDIAALFELAEQFTHAKMAYMMATRIRLEGAC